MRLALIGDGESPHLLKWARALAPRVDLWVASSRGFLPEFEAVVHDSQCLALATRPHFEGGNIGLLRQLPRLAGWLKQVQPDWVNPHYLTSHGTLAWLASRWLGAPGQVVGSAWGSDILVTPDKSALWRWLTRQVLAHCALSTSDSQYMAWRMHALGAREVMVFPFGLERPVPAPDAAAKQPQLFFANRGLEPIYAPQRVIAAFQAIALEWPEARLVVANDGSLRPALEAQVRAAGLDDRVQFVGRLDATTQARWYARASWYLSLPTSDSVSVSVLEAMAHGCVPILSDLPANHELVRQGDNGLIVPPQALPSAADLAALAQRACFIAQANHTWVMEQALFGPCVDRFLARLANLQPGGSAADEADAGGPANTRADHVA